MREARAWESRDAEYGGEQRHLVVAGAWAKAMRATLEGREEHLYVAEQPVPETGAFTSDRDPQHAYRDEGKKDEQFDVAAAARERNGELDAGERDQRAGKEAEPSPPRFTYLVAREKAEVNQLVLVFSGGFGRQIGGHDFGRLDRRSTALDDAPLERASGELRGRTIFRAKLAPVLDEEAAVEQPDRRDGQRRPWPAGEESKLQRIVERRSGQRRRRFDAPQAPTKDEIESDRDKRVEEEKFRPRKIEGVDHAIFAAAARSRSRLAISISPSKAGR